MNTGRSVVIKNIVESFGNKLEAISKASPMKAQKLTEELANDIKNNNFAKQALVSFTTDVASKIEKKGSGAKDEIAGSASGEAGGGSMYTKGVNSLLQATPTPSLKEMKKIYQKIA